MWRTSDAARPRPTARPSSANCSIADCSAPTPPAKPKSSFSIPAPLPPPPIRTRAPPSAAFIAKILTRKILVTGCYAQRAPEEISALAGRQPRRRKFAQTRTGRAMFLPSHRRPGFRSSGADLAQPTPSVIVGDIFAHTELMAAPVFDGEVVREDASQPESAGWLQQSLLVLHYSLRARTEPLAEAGAGSARSRCPGAKRLSRDRAVGHQPGPLGTRTHAANELRLHAARDSASRRRSRSFASARSSPWTGPTK